MARAPAAVSGDDWSDDELHASVVAYFDMESKLRAGIPVVKSQVYLALSNQFARTHKSFEFRMQNISYVLSTMGRTWIPGLKPARNVGANVAGKIEQILAELEGRSYVPVVVAAIEQKEIAKRQSGEPSGSKKPTAKVVAVTQYDRDLAVRAWVLQQAKGTCECCSMPAPFDGANGPFLEVHHVRQLAEGGSDTPANAIAVCPNCHRRLHFALNVAEIVDSIYARIPRLVREGVF
jgi:5-methylcytosine-specific restriction protein A